MERRITPVKIESLKDNEVFVFGSNVQGEHVGGAAYTALKKFGACMGQGVGLQGQSWALPTCKRVNRLTAEGVEVRVTEPLSIKDIISYIRHLFMDARGLHSDKVFYVTKVGCGIAGFSVAEIAPYFAPLCVLENVYLPIEFWEYYDKRK